MATVAVTQLLSCAGGPERRPVTRAEYLEVLHEDLRALEVDFEWWLDNRAEKAFGYRFKELLEREILARNRTSGAPLTITNAAFIAAFESAVSSYAKEGVLDRLTRSGTIDLHSGFWDFGEGNRIHAEFSFRDEDPYLVRCLLIRRPNGSSAKVAVSRLDDGVEVYDTSEFALGSINGFRVRVNKMFAHLDQLHTVQVIFEAPGGKEKTRYRCFLAREPSKTAFLRIYPLPVENIEAELDETRKKIETSDRRLITSLREDVARLYYEIGLYKPKLSERARVERFFRILKEAGEKRFIEDLKQIRFPNGLVARVDEQRTSVSLLRLTLEGKDHRLMFLRPENLETVYDSAWVDGQNLRRAQRDRFNFGSWLPDLWHGSNEQLFMSVYAINKAKATASGKRLNTRQIFDRTLTDMKRVGAYFEEQKVRINSVAFRLKIDEADVSRLLAKLDEELPDQAQELDLPADASPLHRTMDWKLVRVEENGMTFIKDADLLYYRVEKADVSSGRPLEAVRDKLRSRFPGVYDYSLVFSGFRREHVFPGMLIPVPRAPEDRQISSLYLKELILDACRSLDYDYPELIYALVWNECHAGLDNFFRFEARRVDKVLDLKARLTGDEKKRFEELFGRFSVLLAGSWGPGHILYETAWALGFRGSPGELAKPENNIRLMVQYLKARNIDRDSSIKEISYAYNGPRYAANQYHKRLKKNLERALEAFST